MNRRRNSFVLVLLLVFVASCVALPENSKAFVPNITLGAIGITETTVTLSWNCTEAPIVESYTLFMTTAASNSFKPIWTSGKNQTTTVVSNLSPSSTYYFFIQDIDPHGIQSSDDIEVKTTSDPTLWFTNKTLNTATLQWSDDNKYTSLVPFGGYIIEEITNASSNQWRTIVDIKNQTERTYDIQSTNQTYVRMYIVIGDSPFGSIKLSYSNIVMIGNETASPTPVMSEFPAVLAITFLLMTALAVAVISTSKHTKES